MSLFKKTPPPEVPQRRRPLQDGNTRPAEVFSYHSRRSNSQSNTGRLDAAEIEALHADKSKQWPWQNHKWRSIGIAWLALILIVLLTNLSGRPAVTLQNPMAAQHIVQDKSVYDQAVTNYFQANLLRQNKVTFDGGQMQQTIKTEFPELKNVAVHVSIFSNAPKVTLTPYRAAYILVTSTHEALLLDETGRAVTSINQASDSDNLHLSTINDQSGRSIQPGSQALPSITVSFIDTVTGVLRSRHVDFGALTLPAGTSELDVAISGKPYIAKFNLQADARQQAGTLVATKLHLEKDHTTPGQYIDVRVPGRAYFK